MYIFKIDQILDWKYHISDIAVKINRANALLPKINFVTISLLIFDSQINYANLVWAQNSNCMNRILKLQKKAMKIINFQSRNCHSSPLFSNLNYVNSLLLPVFNIWFTICSNIHNYEGTPSAACELFKPSFHINLYGKKSITLNAIDAWNKAETSLGDPKLKDLTLNKIKTIIMKRMIDSY